MSSIVAATQLALVRLKRTSVLVALALATLFVATLSLIERGSNPLGAADRALTSGVFGVVMPLCAFVVVDAITQGQSLEASIFVLARYGANRRACILGLLATSILTLAAIIVPLSILCICLARGLGDPQLLRDIAATSWVALVGAGVYSAWFNFASTFGPAGCAWALGIDFVLGSGTSLIAGAWPRGHLRNLAGGSPVLDLSQREAMMTLAGLSAVYLLIAQVRSAR